MAWKADRQRAYQLEADMSTQNLPKSTTWTGAARESYDASCKRMYDGAGALADWTKDVAQVMDPHTDRMKGHLDAAVKVFNELWDKLETKRQEFCAIVNADAWTKKMDEMTALMDAAQTAMDGVSSKAVATIEADANELEALTWRSSVSHLPGGQWPKA